MDYLRDIITNRGNGIISGIPSYCTANETVIEACLEQALPFAYPVLIEATANQVNQFGGYTGMHPEDFRAMVFDKATRIGFPLERLILGGDHLGPLVWANEPASTAMAKAHALIGAYVEAGYQKIHIDTSMRLGDDDPDLPLAVETVARRGAELYAEAMRAYERRAASDEVTARPVFIIGSEVPIPGGAQNAEDALAVTRPEAVQATLHAYEEAFLGLGASDAFADVIALVVQPGVEFGDDSVHVYDRTRAAALCSCAMGYPNIVLEGHSTDYQSRKALRAMVEDGIAILKVGPALTFALREGLLALSLMEERLLPPKQRAMLMQRIDAAMLRNPGNWVRHYHGSAAEIACKRVFSYSDRCRYYLSDQDVQQAQAELFDNMSQVEIPMSMLHQFMPLQYEKVVQGQLSSDPRSLVKDFVVRVMADYRFACGWK